MRNIIHAEQHPKNLVHVGSKCIDCFGPVELENTNSRPICERCRGSRAIRIAYYADRYERGEAVLPEGEECEMSNVK